MPELVTTEQILCTVMLVFSLTPNIDCNWYFKESFSLHMNYLLFYDFIRSVYASPLLGMPISSFLNDYNFISRIIYAHI